MQSSDAEADALVGSPTKTSGLLLRLSFISFCLAGRLGRCFAGMVNHDASAVAPAGRAGTVRDARSAALTGHHKRRLKRMM